MMTANNPLKTFLLCITPFGKQKSVDRNLLRSWSVLKMALGALRMWKKNGPWQEWVRGKGAPVEEHGVTGFTPSVSQAVTLLPHLLQLVHLFDKPLYISTYKTEHNIETSCLSRFLGEWNKIVFVKALLQLYCHGDDILFPFLFFIKVSVQL